MPIIPKKRNSLDDLRKTVAAKRCRVPKLNATLLEDDIIDSQDFDNDISRNKKRKSDQSARKMISQIETAKEIIDAYRAHASSHEETKQRTDRKSGTGLKPKQATLKPKQTISKPKHAVSKPKQTISTPKQNNQAGTRMRDIGPSIEQYDINSDMFDSEESGQTIEFSNHRNADELEIITREDTSMKLDLEKCHQEVKDLKTEATRWKKLYDDLKTGEQFSLTEETGKKILAALEKKQDVQQISAKGADVSAAGDNGSKVLLNKEMKDLGGGVQVKRTVYETLMRTEEPSKFLINLAHCVWGVEALTNRCVRKQGNVKEPQLEDDKKEIVIRQFQRWLKGSDYAKSKKLMANQLSKVNKYFNSAITSARKKLNPDKKQRVSNKENNTKKRSAPKLRHDVKSPIRNVLKESNTPQSNPDTVDIGKNKIRNDRQDRDESSDSDITIFNVESEGQSQPLLILEFPDLRTQLARNGNRDAISSDLSQVNVLFAATNVTSNVTANCTAVCSTPMVRVLSERRVISGFSEISPPRENLEEELVNNMALEPQSLLGATTYKSNRISSSAGSNTEEILSARRAISGSLDESPTREPRVLDQGELVYSAALHAESSRAANAAITDTAIRL